MWRTNAKKWKMKNEKKWKNIKSHFWKCIVEKMNREKSEKWKEIPRINTGLKLFFLHFSVWPSFHQNLTKSQLIMRFVFPCWTIPIPFVFLTAIGLLDEFGARMEYAGYCDYLRTDDGLAGYLTSTVRPEHFPVIFRNIFLYNMEQKCDFFSPLNYGNELINLFRMDINDNCLLNYFKGAKLSLTLNKLVPGLHRLPWIYLKNFKLKKLKKLEKFYILNLRFKKKFN